MTPEQFQRVEWLFERACMLTDPDRIALLDGECGDDPEVKRAVQRMLQEDARSGSFLDTPVAGNDANLNAIAAMATSRFDEPEIPRSIGRYEIARIIGAGGMGVVYEARQERPRRIVALKVIRPGMTASGALRRFQQEADVLGRLQHPGIAQIYEAGVATVTSASGAVTRQPFFAMELVRGAPLTAYAQNESLGRHARLEIVARVCDAVHHAHQKGIIHRDLKPGNILVDDTGQPKILDFGVARITDADVAAATQHTHAGQIVGTLAYMSPEQLLGDSGLLDTRSDVYSLGIILYELLGGRVPLDCSSCSIAEAARMIRDEEPVGLGSVDRGLRGEIDTIVAMAMDKDKTRRYQSASDLGADIRHYLSSEPIEAKRDSALYMLRKTLRRYRGLATATALLVVMLTAFGIVSFSQSRQNRRLADGLATTLADSNIERARLFARTGDVLGAEDLLWREFLANPRSDHAYWALWELYAQNPCQATFIAHAGELRGAAFSPDGRNFATCSLDDMVRIWDARSFELVATLVGHSDRVNCVDFSPDGRWIASASFDGTVMIWDAAKHDRVRTLRGHAGKVHAVSFVEDGQLVASGGDDATVRVWDVTTGECVHVHHEHHTDVVAMRYNQAHRVLAALARDGTIKLWDNLLDPSIATLSGNEVATAALAFSPDGRRLAWGGNDTRFVNLWTLTDPPRRKTLGEPNNGTVRFLAFEPDGESLISGGWYRIERWDLATGRRRPLIGYGAIGGALSPDGHMLVTGTAAGAVRVTDILANTGVMQLGGKANVGVASICPDGRIIACGDDTDHVRLWETTTGRLLARLPSATGRWSSAQFNPAGTVLATCGADGVVQIWDLKTGTRRYAIDGVHVTTEEALAFSPDGQIMAVTRPDETVQILDATNGEVITSLPSLGTEALAVCFSPDGELIATTHRDGPVAVWTKDGRRVCTMNTVVTPWTVEFRPDGRKLAIGCWGRHFQTWNLDSCMIDVRVGDAKAVTWGVSYMPTDANILATCSGDGRVRLWNLSQQRNVLTLDAFGGSDALSVSFTPDGKTLVASGFDGSLRVWDIEYYDRHIAGNLEYQIDQLRDELGSNIRTDDLRAWAAELRKRPWPRIGPYAQHAVDHVSNTASRRGIDPAVIAAWGKRKPPQPAG